MSDIRIKHFDELCTHKKYIIDSCKKLALYYLEIDNEDFALALMKRAFVHDMSKLDKDEFHSADAFGVFREHSKVRDFVFSETQKDFLELHWENNSHHPEHFEDISTMGELDLAEMVCDWYARSVEFNDNLLDYIEYRQNNRFAFPEDMYKKILFYANILTS